MSRAVVISGPAGKPGQVYYSLKHKDLPRPTIGPNDLLVRMTAAALNHRDLFIRQHLYPGTSFDIPLLADGCGVVVETGKEATNWKGKRVILNPGTGWKDSLEGPEDSNGYAILGGTKYNPLGTLQEYLSVDASQVEEAPKHLSDVEAAALPVTALTAWRVVFVKAGLGQSASPGKKVLITGIGGGVALMALMFAVGAGAEVWVTSSSQEKIDKAKELGATGGINYRKDGWEKDLLAASKGEKKQFDAIIDGAGGDAIEKAVKLLKHGGIVAVYGMTLSPKMPFLMSAVLKNIEVKGSTMGSRKEFADMTNYVKEKGLQPVVSKVLYGIDDLRKIDDLFEDMKKGSQFGKLVIVFTATEDRATASRL